MAECCSKHRALEYTSGCPLCSLESDFRLLVKADIYSAAFEEAARFVEKQPCGTAITTIADYLRAMKTTAGAIHG